MDQIHNVNNIEELQDRLKMLEQQRRDEWKAIKDRVSNQYERFKPSNIIHNAFSSVSESLHKDADMINEGAALASGIVVNAIMAKSKNKELKKWVNLVVFSLVTYFVTKHREDILEAGEKIVNKISDKLQKMKAKREERKRQREAEAEQGED